MKRAQREFLMRGHTPPQQSWCSISKPKMKDGKSSAKVYIFDEIGFWGTTADSFSKQLDELDVDEIELHLNSPGGDIFDGLAIYNTLKKHRAKVTVYVDGLAASAASFIAQAGDEILMGTGTSMMIHDGWGICIGNEADMLETGSVLGKLSNDIASIYAKEAGGDTETWRELMRQEVWYGAQEAVDAGLAHALADPADDEEEDSETKDKLERSFNLKTFVAASYMKYEGRDEAPDPNTIRRDVRAKMALHKTKEQQMSDTPAESTPAPVVPDSTTNQPVVETPAAPEPTEDGGTEVNPPQEGGAEAQPATQPSASSKGGTQVFNLGNGRTTSDPAEAQRYIDGLNQTFNQQRAAARKTFVDSLGSDGKVPAPSLAGVQSLVDTLSDDQFEAYKATWASVPASPLFARHGSDQGGNNPQSNAEPVEGSLEYHEQIVARHRLAGLSESAIAATASGQFVAKHKSNTSS